MGQVVSESEDSGSNRHRGKVLVEPGQMAMFHKRLDKLNRTALQLGLRPIQVLAVQDVVYDRRLEHSGGANGRTWFHLVGVPKDCVAAQPVMLKQIELEYPQIQRGGWDVIGKLEAVDGGNLAFAVTADEADTQALRSHSLRPIACEHCKTNRLRKESYLLRERETGQYAQVGSQCLELFAGIDPAQALFMARMSDLLREAESDLEAFAQSGRLNAVDTRQFLASVSFLVDRFGFVSATKAREGGGLMATFDAAQGISALLQKDERMRAAYAEQLPEHLAKADVVRAWVLGRSADSSFDANIRLLMSADAISMDRKHLAFAAAAIPMYNRSLRAESESAKPSQHIGNPGQKMVLAVQIERVVPFETRWGVSNAVLMRDEDGNRLKWFTGSCPEDIRRGEGRWVEVAFTVKEHSEYKEVAQTELSRVKAVRWLDGPPELDPGAAAPMDSQQQDAPRYRVSMFRHAHGRDVVFEDCLLDGVLLSAAQLQERARERGISIIRGGADFRWFVSEPVAEQFFSLYINEVSGKEPMAEDYEQLSRWVLGSGPLVGKAAPLDLLRHEQPAHQLGM